MAVPAVPDATATNTGEAHKVRAISGPASAELDSLLAVALRVCISSSRRAIWVGGLACFARRAGTPLAAGARPVFVGNPGRHALGQRLPHSYTMVAPPQVGYGN